MNTKNVLTSAGLSLLLAASSVAQDAPHEGRQHDTELPQISVIDKLLAVEASLNAKKHRSSEEEWSRDYEDLYQRSQRNGQLSMVNGGGKNDTMNALALGIKASDAVLALKGRDVEGLNMASEQIEQIALKLGASKKELGMADTVKRYADGKRWLDAFMALGFLQRNVLYYLKENPEKKPQAVLIILGGWMQGGRCVTSVIEKEYTDEVSNILREPRLVDLFKKNVDDLPPEILKDPLIQDIAKQLPEIRKRVAVGFHDPVKLEDVKWLHQTFNGFVMRILPKPESKDAPDKPATTADTTPPPATVTTPAATTPATPATPAKPAAPVAEIKPATPAPVAKPAVATHEAPAPVAPPKSKPWWQFW